jgi:hypothetical protein
MRGKFVKTAQDFQLSLALAGAAGWQALVSVVRRATKLPAFPTLRNIWVKRATSAYCVEYRGKVGNFLWHPRNEFATII